MTVALLYLLLIFLWWSDSMFTRSDRARLDIKNICNALKLYRAHKGRYPTTQEGLRALVSIQALEQLPKDPWNYEYHYALQGGLPIIWSNGADGAPGGEGNDADISNISPLPPWMMDGNHSLPPRAKPPPATCGPWDPYT
jgi:type II secretion system protein G